MNDIEELYLPDSFHDALQILVPSLSSKDLNLLQGFQAALIEANQRVNLTRIENSLDFQFKHLIDSALLLYSLRKSTLAKKNYSSLLDFGTGGGIPGVPLAILKSLDRLVLVDARRKKVGSNSMDDRPNKFRFTRGYLRAFVLEASGCS